MSKKGRSKQSLNCRDCRRILSHRGHASQQSRLFSFGVSRDDVSLILPRCDRCVTRYIQAGHIAIPQVAIARCLIPVALVSISPDLWGATLADIQEQKADYVCVRTTDPDGKDAFYVATTANLGFPPQPIFSVAATIEHAIVSRPKGTYPRYVATRAWGGTEERG